MCFALTAEDVLFTCCPPAPWALVNSNSISLSSIGLIAEKRVTLRNQFFRLWRVPDGALTLPLNSAAPSIG